MSKLVNQIRRLVEKFRLRWPWIHDPDQGVWVRDGWLIEEGWLSDQSGYRLLHEDGSIGVYPTVREAMLAARAADGGRDG